jgi:hypothetical protein
MFPARFDREMMGGGMETKTFGFVPRPNIPLPVIAPASPWPRFRRSLADSAASVFQVVSTYFRLFQVISTKTKIKKRDAAEE